MSNEMMIPQGSAVSMFGTTDPAAIAAAETAKVRMGMAYMKAMQTPRSPEQSRTKILENCKRPEFAERVEFRKPTGKKKDASGRWVDNFITGPSVRFAEECIRQWGNLLVETQIIYEDQKIRRSKVTCLDLESNSTFTKEIQVSKTVERSNNKGREVLGERVNSWGKAVYIVVATDEELQQKEASLISKAVRNEGLRLIPADIVDEGMRVARETLLNRDATDPKSAMRNITDGFVTVGVYPDDLVGYLGQKLETVSPFQIQELRGIYRSIRDGEVTWADVVNPGDPADDGTADTTDNLKAKMEKAKAEKAARKTESKPQPEGEPERKAAKEASTPPTTEAPAPASNEPDDWELMKGEELANAVRPLAAKTIKNKKVFEQILSQGDWEAMRNLARMIVSKGKK